MYVCAELIEGTCSLWIEQSPLLPPLSIEQGASLGGAVIACYAVAWGFNLLIRFLWNHTR